MPAVACLNGVWQAPNDARVSVLDRGFMFGDGVYEVIPAYQGKPFTLERHLKRLGASLDEIRIRNPMDDAAWTKLIHDAVERCAESPAYVYVQVTRGVAEIRSHEYPANAEPTVLVMAWHAPILSRESIRPYRATVMDDFRWSRGHIKSVSLIAAGMLKNEAIANGYDDAILVRDGLVTESTAANVFIALDGKLVTPPKSNLLLHGITRDLIVELCQDNGVELEEREITVAELEAADEVMISSSGHEIWPVGELDGKPVGNGAAGALWQQVDDLFQAYKAEVCG